MPEGIWNPRTDRGKKAVLLLHGWTADQQSGYLDLPDRLAGRGCATLAVGLPGHGASGGDRDRLSYQDYIRASVDAADELLRRSRCSRLTIIGTSIGGFLAARVAGLRAVDSLVLWVPTDFSDDLVDSGATVAETCLTEEAFAWRSQPHGLQGTGALRALASFRGRVLILEAGDDELVPHQTTANYLAAAPGADRIVLAGTTHALRSQPRQARSGHRIHADLAHRACGGVTVPATSRPSSALNCRLWSLQQVLLEA
ncbi:MAG: alpha/beta fold hydrolase [Acidipropionibacterium sp.]|nr:alpha/beta fold hydrolase [Acidipropionibacterium sp.]